MIAELGPHRIADLADLEGRKRGGEGRHELWIGRVVPPQVAASRRGTGVVTVLVGDGEPVGVIGLHQVLDRSRLVQRGLPLLVGGLRLVVELRVRLDEHVPRALLRNDGAGDALDEDLRNPLLCGRRHDHLVLEVLAILVDQQLAAHVVAIRGVVDPLLRQRVAQPALGRGLAPVDELEHGRAALGLDRADDVAGLGVLQRVEVLAVRRVTILEPAEIAAERCGEVVADVRRDRGEVLASLDPIARVLGRGLRLRALLVGGLVGGLGVVGKRLDQDQAGVHALRKGDALRDAGIQLVVADRDAEVLGARGEDGAVDERVGGLRGEVVEALAEAVDLLLRDLVARAAQRRLQLRDLSDRLGSQDSLADVEVGAVEARAGNRGDRSEVRLPVPVPGRCAEDPDGQRDRDRERDDGELLGAQLVLPARAVLAVEDRS